MDPDLRIEDQDPQGATPDTSDDNNWQQTVDDALSTELLEFLEPVQPRRRQRSQWPASYTDKTQQSKTANKALRRLADYQYDLYHVSDEDDLPGIEQCCQAPSGFSASAPVDLLDHDSGCRASSASTISLASELDNSAPLSPATPVTLRPMGKARFEVVSSRPGSELRNTIPSGVSTPLFLHGVEKYDSCGGNATQARDSGNARGEHSGSSILTRDLAERTPNLAKQLSFAEASTTRIRTNKKALTPVFAHKSMKPPQGPRPAENLSFAYGTEPRGSPNYQADHWRTLGLDDSDAVYCDVASRPDLHTSTIVAPPTLTSPECLASSSTRADSDACNASMLGSYITGLSYGPKMPSARERGTEIIKPTTPMRQKRRRSDADAEAACEEHDEVKVCDQLVAPLALARNKSRITSRVCPPEEPGNSPLATRASSQQPAVLNSVCERLQAMHVDDGTKHRLQYEPPRRLSLPRISKLYIDHPSFAGLFDQMAEDSADGAAAKAEPEPELEPEPEPEPANVAHTSTSPFHHRRIYPTQTIILKRRRQPQVSFDVDQDFGPILAQASGFGLHHK